MTIDRRVAETTVNVIRRHRGTAPATQSPWQFGQALSGDPGQPDYFAPVRHIVTIMGAVADAVTGDGPQFVGVEVPPGHAKTQSLSRWLPAWYLNKYPGRRVGLASYGADVAETHSRWVRELLQRTARDPKRMGELTVRVSPKLSAANAWDTTAGGGMVAVGVGGPLTGKRLHMLIVDDPIKNREEAESRLVRERLWDWWDAVALSRMEPDSAVVVAYARWHPDDLLGRIRERDGGIGEWRFVTMPALAECDEDWGDWQRAAGEPLWPDRFDETALARVRRRNVYEWEALYQQAPPKIRERPGALWTIALLADCRVDVQPDTGQRDDLKRIVIGVDPSMSSEPGSDETGIVVVGLDRNDVAHVIGDRSTPAGALGWPTVLKAAFDEFSANHVVIEQNLGGREAYEAIMKAARISLPTVYVSTGKRGKHTRAEPVAKLYIEREVCHEGFFPELESELTGWRPGDPDSPNRLDALVWAVRWLKVDGSTSSGHSNARDLVGASMGGRGRRGW